MATNVRLHGDGVSRRRFLAGTAIGVCGFAARGFEPLAAAQSDQALLTKTRGDWYPLNPTTLTSADLSELLCAPARVDLGDGVLRGLLAYNGQFPGPTWVARKGDWITVRLINGLTEESITHWHGLVVNFANDGGPHLSVPPGGHYDYNFQVIQRASLNFYHPHPHMLTGKQVALGLAGAFIIRDDEEDSLGLPSGLYEVPLVIRDASLDNRGDLAYSPTSSGFMGKFPLVNGTRNPSLAVDKGVYRFRVLNGSNARVFKLAFSNSAAFTIIGNDGGLLPAPATVTTVELGMGERLDLLVDFSQLPANAAVTLRCTNARWDLMRFVGTGQAGVAYTPPVVLSTIQPLVGPSQPVRTFSFDGMSRINGQQYDMHRIDFRVPFGVTERWRFKTGGNAPHPVHVHGASFQVVSRTGGRARLFPWETGWKDTVLLNDKETVDILIRFDQFRGAHDGQYVMHCHQLEHESMGMMANFIVE